MDAAGREQENKIHPFLSFFHLSCLLVGGGEATLVATVADYHQTMGMIFVWKRYIISYQIFNAHENNCWKQNITIRFISFTKLHFIFHLCSSISYIQSRIQSRISVQVITRK